MSTVDSTTAKLMQHDPDLDGERSMPDHRNPVSRRFSVAPMMDWTDRHCRAFHRVLSARALLYSEMITADAVLRGDQQRLLDFDPCEHPVALQLGGSEPEKLAAAARIAAAAGYDEINLNVGCPSSRVQSGSFGACLMREPDLVADCLSGMREAVSAGIPVTVKHRLGVDDDVEKERLFAFVDILSRAGTRVFIVHARKALLSGLSPKENREVPPLNYHLVRELKMERPDLTIVLNGGIDDVDQANDHLNWADGVMVGRAAYHNPAILLSVDRRMHGMRVVDRSPADALMSYRPYMLRRLEEGVPLHAMTRHMLGLFKGSSGARHWRRALSEHATNRRGAAAIKHFDAAVEIAIAAGTDRSHKLMSVATDE